MIKITYESCLAARILDKHKEQPISSITVSTQKEFDDLYEYFAEADQVGGGSSDWFGTTLGFSIHLSLHGFDQEDVLLESADGY